MKEAIPWKSGFARIAVIFMIPRPEILKMMLHPVLPSKNCRMTGDVLTAGLKKKILKNMQAKTITRYGG